MFILPMTLLIMWLRITFQNHLNLGIKIKRKLRGFHLFCLGNNMAIDLTLRYTSIFFIPMLLIQKNGFANLLDLWFRSLKPLLITLILHKCKIQILQLCLSMEPGTGSHLGCLGCSWGKHPGTWSMLHSWAQAKILKQFTVARFWIMSRNIIQNILLLQKLMTRKRLVYLVWNYIL